MEEMYLGEEMLRHRSKKSVYEKERGFETEDWRNYGFSGSAKAKTGSVSSDILSHKTCA